MPRGSQNRDFGSKNGYKRRYKITMPFGRDFEAIFLQMWVEKMMKIELSPAREHDFAKIEVSLTRAILMRKRLQQ